MQCRRGGSTPALSRLPRYGFSGFSERALGVSIEVTVSLLVAESIVSTSFTFSPALTVSSLPTAISATGSVSGWEPGALLTVMVFTVRSAETTIAVISFLPLASVVWLAGSRAGSCATASPAAVSTSRTAGKSFRILVLLLHGETARRRECRNDTAHLDEASRRPPSRRASGVPARRRRSTWRDRLQTHAL